jgi:hypothetical protein
MRYSLLIFISYIVSSNTQGTFVLNKDHIANQWRHEVGRTLIHDKSGNNMGLVWTRHKSIGIGNALCAFVRVIEDSLMDNQVLFVRSIIIRKFCSLANCSIHPLHDERYSETVITVSY